MRLPAEGAPRTAVTASCPVSCLPTVTTSFLFLAWAVSQMLGFVIGKFLARSVVLISDHECCFTRPSTMGLQFCSRTYPMPRLRFPCSLLLMLPRCSFARIFPCAGLVSPSAVVTIVTVPRVVDEISLLDKLLGNYPVCHSLCVSVSVFVF